MTQYREIIRMASAGIFNQREIAQSLKLSRNTVARTLAKARTCNLTWARIEAEDLKEDQIGALLYPPRVDEARYVTPDFETITKELRKTGVTLQMLWMEYYEANHKGDKQPYLYSRYCDLYRQHMRYSRATMRIPRTPGEQVEVDWSGKTGYLKDPTTGDLKPVYLFVAAMSYSQYCYSEGFLRMDEDSWIRAHVHLFEFLGGVPKTVVPDNLKTGVVKASRSEPVIQKNYRELAEHYGTFIMPARVARPKDKAVVEGAVGKLANNLLGKVRHRTFFTLEEFNDTLWEHVDEYNTHQFQKKLGSRSTLFAEEKDLLAQLPKTRYEIAHWKTATVQPNYHVVADGIYYSVPYQYISQKMDIKITSSLIEIFQGDKRICSHPRLRGRQGQYQTDKSHMPKNHQQYVEWDEARFIAWATPYGPATEAVVRAILNRYEIPQHGFRSCLALLKLPKAHEEEKLERACQKVLDLSLSPNYKVVKSVFRNLETDTTSTDVIVSPSESHAFIRHLPKEESR